MDEIDFNITAATDTGGGFNATTSVATIAPLSNLPDITNSVFINGYSQSGSSWNTLANDDKAVLCIQLNGRMDSGGAGLVINAGNSTVRGLVINGFLNGNGIILQGAGGDRIQGNFIGTDVSGTSAPYGLPDFSTFGTSTSDMANGITLVESLGFQHDYIGIDSGTDPIDPPGWSDLAERNIISACGQGMHIIGSDFPDASQYPAAQTNNVIAGNFIGTDIHGTTALGNWAGLAFEGGTHDDLVGTNGDGTNDSDERNVISGNQAGVVLNGAGSPKDFGAYRCVLAGNWIGIDADGNPMGNLWGGVAVEEGGLAVRIGGPSAVLSNTIAYSGNSAPSLHYDLASNGTPYAQAAGVWGFTVGGEIPLDNTVQGNSIYGNAGLGIDLGGSYPPLAADGVTPNDSEGHVGPNNFQNFPVLNSASSSSTSTSVTGSFSEATEPNTTITLDFYANSTGSSTTYGQGQIYLGSRTVVTDASGNASFNAAFALGNLAGDWISATATDQDGNTSEFSQDIQAASAPGQTFTQSLPAALPQSTTSTNTLAIQADTATINDVVTALSPSNLGSSVVPVSVYLNLAPGTYTATTVQIPAGMTLYINGTPGTTIDPALPAFTLASGNVVVSNVTFLTTGDAPTIRVTGGSLILRNDTIQESTGYNDAAIEVTGGTVDLGTASDPGGNTININGAGAFAHNTTSTPISAIGDTFTVNGLPLTLSTLSGTVFEDFNDDGQIDFGEQGIANVLITLTGTDDLGNAVSQSQQTDADGVYVFNLRPGNYTITETQPAGYAQGIDSVGKAGGSLSATDQFFVNLAPAVNGENYNFGEQPAATGLVRKGQTAGIGFWNNTNGQALILAFNGGSGTQLADWLAATLPNMFGANAGSNDLAGKSNADVAALFQSDFVVKGTKLDAQVLATALSVYATNTTLDSTGVAAKYGFVVSGDGVGSATWSAGSSGDAFGVADNTIMTVMDLLLATDAQAIKGLLYNGNTTKRSEAYAVYSALNQAGSVS